MAKQPEAKIVDEVMAAILEKWPRAYVRKIADRFTRGIFDLIVKRPLANCEVRIEVKQPGRDLDPAQKIEADAMSTAGIPWTVVSSAQQAIDWLEGKGHAFTAEPTRDGCGWRIRWKAEDR